MKKFALALAMAGSLSAPMIGCTQTQQVAGGAAAGAVAGQLIGRDTGSTVAGAIIGGAAAFLVSENRNSRGECLWRRKNGDQFYAPCP